MTLLVIEMISFTGHVLFITLLMLGQVVLNIDSFMRSLLTKMVLFSQGKTRLIVPALTVRCGG